MAQAIMIVDDSASMRQFASTVLRGAGYELIVACDGKDALPKLNGRKVHLIIGDVNVPNIDGITFVKAVKNLPEHKDTPIIMITTGLIKSSREQASEPGVRAWLVKPFDKGRLLEMVGRFALP